MASSDTTYDCIIIGGGPAGLTCAIFLARYRRKVLLVDNGHPRNAPSHGVHGFLGHHGILPGDLLARGRDEAVAAGVEICDCTATKLEKNADIFEVTTSTGCFHSRRIVLAYGVRDELPDIPNVREFYGASVFHCPDCDGYEVSDKSVGVIGWGKRVVGLSLKLLQWTERITIFTDGHERDWDADSTSKLLAECIAVKDEKVISLLGDAGQATGAVLASGEHVGAEAFFFSIGCVRTCGLAEQIGCEVFEETPNIKVDEYKQTTVEGAYAIGDLVAGSQLVVTSAADGAVAAIAINKSLLPPGRVV